MARSLITACFTLSTLSKSHRSFTALKYVLIGSPVLCCRKQNKKKVNCCHARKLSPVYCIRLKTTGSRTHNHKRISGKTFTLCTAEVKGYIFSHLQMVLVSAWGFVDEPLHCWLSAQVQPNYRHKCNFFKITFLAFLPLVDMTVDRQDTGWEKEVNDIGQITQARNWTLRRVFLAYLVCALPNELQMWNSFTYPSEKLISLHPHKLVNDQTCPLIMDVFYNNLMYN